MEGQVELKDQELMQYEQSMMKLTDELSELKDRLADIEADNEAKSNKVQEL